MKCKAYTKNGTKCTRAVKNGKYCWQHKNRTINEKYCSCVAQVKRKSPNVNAFAVCSVSVPGRTTNSCKQFGYP